MPPVDSPRAASSNDGLPSTLWVNHRASQRASHASRTARASGRRRLVDPATCERDYNDAELEFMFAIDQYKRASGRQYPTWSEVLEVLHGLGYRKDAEIATS